MNKRLLKKQVKYVCGDLASCVLFEDVLFGDAKNDPKVAEIVDKIAGLQVDTLKNATFSFDKVERDFESKAAYRVAREKYNKLAYTKLVEDFNDKVADILHEINSLRPKTEEKK